MGVTINKKSKQQQNHRLRTDSSLSHRGGGGLNAYIINSNANTTTENLPHEQNVTNRPDPLYDSNKLILGVQNQVTNFIMRKVAKQLLQLEQMDEIVQTEVEKTDYRDRGVYSQNREMTQQQGHTEATVAHEKMTADP